MVLTLRGTLKNPETLRNPDGSVNEESTAFIAFERGRNPQLDQVIQNGAPAEGVRVIIDDIGGHTKDTDRLTNNLRHMTFIVLAPDELGAVMIEYERPTQIAKGDTGHGKLTDAQRMKADGTKAQADSSASAANEALRKWKLAK